MEGKLVDTFLFDNLPVTVLGGIIRKKVFLKEDEYKFKPRILNSIGKVNEYYYDKKRKKEYLINIKSKEPVIKNYRVAGTQKLLQINAQILHSDNQTNHFDSIKIKKALSQYFLERLPVFEGELYNFPIYIEFIYIVKEFKKERDLDNFKGFYEKVFLDCIQTKIFGDGNFGGRNTVNLKGFIDNDSIEYINKISHELIINENIENNKLIIKIYEQ